MADLATRVKTDKALLKRALRDPGLRSKLPGKYLSPNQRKARALRIRLDAPITQGSSITERQLARQANAAEQVQYGPQQTQLNQQLASAQQFERDTGSFYDDYLAKLAQNQRDIANVQAGAQQALANLGASVTGLAGTSAQQLQGQANADAASRGATAGDLTQMASGAAGARQALMGSFGAQQVLTGAGANTAAANLANVVGPQQKMQAQAQAQRKTAKVREDLTSLAATRGAYNQQYRQQQRTEEGKNVIARAALNLKEETAQGQLEEAGKRRRSQERQTTARINAAATQKQADRDARAAVAAQKAHEPNKYGVPADQWAGWSTSHRQRVIDSFGKKGGAGGLSKQEADDFYRKYGVKPQGTSAVARGRDNVASVQALVNRLQVPKTPAGRSKLYDTLVNGQAADKANKVKAIAKQNPLWTRVALDLWQFGGVTNSTADKLHHAGYSVRTLGLKPAPTTTQRNTAAYGKASPQPQGHY